MNYISVIGISAAVLTTLANIPQTYKIIKEKNTEGVSAYTYTLLLFGTSLWTIYGILNGDWPIIIANSISVLTCLIILFLNFTSNKAIEKIHEAILPEEIKKEVRDKECEDSR